MKVSVDKITCTGCGTCQALCPQVFEIREDGKSYVLEGADLNCCDIHEIAASCPTGAILVED